MLTKLFKGLSNSNTDSQPPLWKSLEAFFTANNIDVRETNVDEDKTRTYYFGYQGGNFAAEISRSGMFMTVWFPSFYDVEADKIDVMRMACNRFNNSARVFKVYYDHSESDSRLVVHMTFACDVVNADELKSRLEACFYYQRQFNEIYEEIEKMPGSGDKEVNINNRERRLFLISQQEMLHSGDPMDEHRFDLDARYTLDQLIHRIFTVEGIEYKELTISTKDGVETVTEPDAIAQADLLSAMVLPDATGYRSNVATMVVRYALAGVDEDLYITVTLTPAGVDDTSCYVRVTLTDVPRSLSDSSTLDGHVASNGTDSILLAVDRESTEKKQAEFKYMWEDAQLKIKAGEELDDEQRFLAAITTPSQGYSFYWGARHFHQGRYYEALIHLENCYEQIRREVKDQDSYDSFALVCFYIGFCYNELGNHRMAYFYLDHLRSSSRIQYVEEYINTLANHGDLRAFAAIDHHYDELTRAMEQDNDVPDYVHNFREFLLRRRGYTLVEFNRLDDAEDLFKKLLDSPDSHDYAVDELAYIQRLRRDQEGDGIEDVDAEDTPNEDTPNEE